jgi:hypothetical protein
LKYLKSNHESKKWKNNGLELTDEAIKPLETLRRTIVKVTKFYHPDTKDNFDAGLDWF